MNTIQGMVDQVIKKVVQAQKLVQAQKTAPVYLKQADLMKAAGITKVHTFNQIVTLAALQVPAKVPGFALMYNSFDGYRLADKAEVRDLKMQLRKLRTARTIVARVITVLSVVANGPMIQMIAASLKGTVTQIEVAISALDQAI